MTETTPETEAPAVTGWRADPRWRLLSWDPGYFTAAPPDVPLLGAELAQPEVWASFYEKGRIVATWGRT